MAKRNESKLTDLELFKRWQIDRDRSASQQIFEKYQIVVFGRINSVLRDKDLSNELTIQVFEKLFRFDKPVTDTLLGFLSTMARNKAYEVLRMKNNRQKEIELTENLKNNPNLVTSNEAEMTFALQESEYIIEMANLTEIEKKCYYKKKEGLSYKMIAQRIGKSEARVHQIVKSAYKKIRSTFEKTLK